MAHRETSHREELADHMDVLADLLDAIADLAAYRESKHLSGATVHLLAAIRLIHDEREHKAK